MSRPAVRPSPRPSQKVPVILDLGPFGSTPFLRAVQRGDPSVCSKCKTAKSIAIFRSLGICAECHVSAVRLRLHFAVMRMRPRPTEPILVAFSGGPGSTALLSLVDSYTNQDVRRTRKFGRILACHIDETAVLPLEDFGLLPDELISSISEAAKINERVDFVVEKLESVFDGDLGELSLKGLSLGSGGLDFFNPTWQPAKGLGIFSRL